MILSKTIDADLQNLKVLPVFSHFIRNLHEVIMFALVVVVLWSSVCLADLKQDQLKTYSTKISEADFSLYFSKTFSARSILLCTSECTKTGSNTALFSEDTRLCSCHKHTHPDQTDGGKDIHIMQKKGWL